MPSRMSQSRTPSPVQTQPQPSTSLTQPTTTPLNAPLPTLSAQQSMTPEQLIARRNQDFGRVFQAGQDRRLTNPDVVKAVIFQAANVGGGAAFAFGLGRSIGAGALEAIVKAAFEAPQLAGVGPDTVSYEDSPKHTAQMLVTPVARAVGAMVGGGIGASVGNVVAQRLAAMTGRQFKPVPANVLVPDHVANLIDPENNLHYGEAGVNRLREQVTAIHRQYHRIDGDVHIQAGEVAFGVGNAVRGLAQGKQPMGMPVDVPVSAGVSLASGAATGAYAAIEMANHRMQLPDPRHPDSNPAQMVDMPTFFVGDPADIPNRFTGPTAAHTAMNILKGTGNRVAHMAKATWSLSLANEIGTAIAAAMPHWTGDVGHRIVQGLESGGGVAMAVDPWFSSQPTILGNDQARIEGQQPRSDNIEMGDNPGT